MSELINFDAWWSNYDINIDGTDEEQQLIFDAMKEKITTQPFEKGSNIQIFEVYDISTEEDVKALAISMANAAPKASFKMTGLINTETTGGELQDFEFNLKSGKLTGGFSDWYTEHCMEYIEDYEDFCDCVGEFDEEEYNEVKDCEFVYVIETDDGEKLLKEVPIENFEEIIF